MRDDFRTLPEDTQVAVGQTARLECRPPRGQPDPKVTWKMDGELMSMDNNRIHIDELGSLVISKARRADSGSYVCVASNKAAVRETPAMQLDVMGEWMGLWSGYVMGEWLCNEWVGEIVEWLCDGWVGEIVGWLCDGWVGEIVEWLCDGYVDRIVQWWCDGWVDEIVAWLCDGWVDEIVEWLLFVTTSTYVEYDVKNKT